jgi:hypothetical protein
MTIGFTDQQTSLNDHIRLNGGLSSLSPLRSGRPLDVVEGPEGKDKKSGVRRNFLRKILGLANRATFDVYLPSEQPVVSGPATLFL